MVWAFASAVYAEQKKLEVPEYSIEGITPKTIYLMETKSGIVFPFHNEKLIPYAKEFGHYVFTKNVFKIDTNGDQIKDLWHIVYSFPEKKQKDRTIHQFRQIEIYIDVSPNGLTYKRVLIDRRDEEGHLGADGKFEKEIIFNNEPPPSAIPFLQT